MIEVKEIPLDITLPEDGIGIVVMQPFVELCDREPFCWQNDKKGKQIDRIVRTLEIAGQADHGCEKTHFTVFPEYAIPGLEGVRKIQEILESSGWKDGTIIIGGVDGLTKSEYSTLCSENNTEVCQENGISKVRDEQWVNCCIIWSKEANGAVTRWVQLKLIPATQEELCSAYHMFEGRAVYLFKSKISIQGRELPFRFLSFICKDWIGNIGNTNAVDNVLLQIDGKREGTTDRLDIYLCFILKRNPHPDYPLFLQKTMRYLNEDIYTTIRRSDGAVLFINNAGKNGPGYCENFGKSGFVFHPNCSFVSHEKCCPPTYSLKAREGLATCKEARFRESGACITSFKFRPPISAIVRRNPATPMIPMNPAIVYSVDALIGEIEEDPRTAGSEVPATIKWVNDCLDTIDFVLKNEDSHPLKNEIKDSHEMVCKEIRKQSDEFLCRYITIASYEIENEKDKWIEIESRIIHNVDNWDEDEQKTLATVVDSLSIMKACKPLGVNGSPAHATIKLQDKVIDIVVVSGRTHEDCFEYAKIKCPGSGQRFVVVITHDWRSSLPETQRRGSILEGTSDSNQDTDITNPDRSFYQYGYQNLIDSCFQSQSLEELNSKMPEIIRV